MEQITQYLSDHEPNTCPVIKEVEEGGVEFDDKKQLKCIIVQFDDEAWGKNQRAKYPHYTKKYTNYNGTPIFRAEHEYNLLNGQYGHAARGKLLQFPLVLMYALTSHKMQVI